TGRKHHIHFQILGQCVQSRRQLGKDRTAKSHAGSAQRHRPSAATTRFVINSLHQHFGPSREPSRVCLCIRCDKRLRHHRPPICHRTAESSETSLSQTTVSVEDDNGVSRSPFFRIVLQPPRDDGAFTKIATRSNRNIRTGTGGFFGGRVVTTIRHHPNSA